MLLYENNFVKTSNRILKIFTEVSIEVNIYYLHCRLPVALLGLGMVPHATSVHRERHGKTRISATPRLVLEPVILLFDPSKTYTGLLAV
jgi:hypothetical protein